MANLWSQPLDGGPAKQITNKENCGCSRPGHDNKQFAITRGSLRSDVVLLRDFR
jgi:hypothetical protein